VRPAALLLVGLWLGMLFASWVMATVNFRVADAVLDGKGDVQARLAPLPVADQRLVLRHLASEINRWMFGRWAMVQLALGVVLVALLWGAGTVPRLLAVAALVLVLVQALALGPAIQQLGRSLDFVPRPLPPDVGRRFGLLHGGYVLADLVRAGVLLALAVLALRRAS
jgi:hypothetical protein